MADSSDSTLKNFVREIHRRNVWQILGIYVVASWVVLQVIDVLANNFDLPSWFPALALGLLLVGLPIVLATAFMYEPTDSAEASRDGTDAGSNTSSAKALGVVVYMLAGWGVIAAVLVVLGGGVGSIVGLNGGAVEGIGSQTLRVGRIERITFDPALELTPIISADGSQVVYTATGAAGDSIRNSPAQLVVRQVDGERAIPLTNGSAADERFARYSTEGNRLVFESGDRLYEVPSLGGEARPLFASSGSAVHRFPTFSPDNTRTAYIDGDTISIFDRATGEHRELASEPAAHSLVWSPGGDWLAFVTGNEQSHMLGPVFGNVAPSAIKIVSADGGTVRTVIPNTESNTSPAWLPDGRLLFVSTRGGGADIYVTTIDDDGAPIDNPERLTTGLDPHSIAVSADGRFLVYTTLIRRQNAHVIEIPQEGTVSGYDGRPVTTGLQIVEGLAISPDGTSIAYDSSLYGNQDIFHRALDGDREIRVTSHPADEFVRDWSADGEWLSGHDFRNGNRDPFVIRLDGTAYENPVDSGFHERYASFSPDGTTLMFDRQVENTYTLHTVTRDQGFGWMEPEFLAEGRDGDWSRDGSRIAFVRLDEGLWVIQSDGTGLRQLAAGRARGTRWTDDGKALIYLVDLDDGTSAFRVIDVETGASRAIVTFADRVAIPRGEFAVGGGRIYYSFSEMEGDLYRLELLGSE